jgi:lipoprotein NlpD
MKSALQSPLSLQAPRRLLAMSCLLLAACAAPRPAPVSDARPAADGNAPIAAKAVEPAAAVAEPAKPVVPPPMHIVQRGETLYSIAMQHALDYRELAAWNNIVNPALIRVGDALRINPPGSADPASLPAGVSTAPLRELPPPIAVPLANTPPPSATLPPSAAVTGSKLKTEPKAGRVPYSDAAYAKLAAENGALVNLPATPVPGVVGGNAAPTAALPPSLPAVANGANGVIGVNGAIDWAWPVKGKVLSNFTELSKGIDIAGSRNAPVLAAAGGKVLHSGSAIRGYGRLVIIKHSDTWLSAYAYNEKLLVSEGEDVKKGQKIAEMGSSDTDSVKLHFEIRNKGQPVDPLKFLPAQ